MRGSQALPHLYTRSSHNSPWVDIFFLLYGSLPSLRGLVSHSLLLSSRFSPSLFLSIIIRALFSLHVFRFHQTFAFWPPPTRSRNSPRTHIKSGSDTIAYIVLSSSEITAVFDCGSCIVEGSGHCQWNRILRPSRGPPRISINLPPLDPSATSAWSPGHCHNLLVIHLGDQAVRSYKFAQMSNLASPRSNMRSSNDTFRPTRSPALPPKRALQMLLVCPWIRSM